ncbi:MAG: DUF4197 domain-containing protein [Hyphomicrobiales bacterium]|nr:DUF4197 domain-containing protein [Hyphomicrobiales bacterium]MCP5370656.1 DUF4197 domain-containing protein [Hyphomicrobiales bacterium]
MRFRLFLILAALAVVAAPALAPAQSNWLGKAKDLLNQGSGSGSGGTSAAGNLTTGEIASGLREALRVGTERVVGQLGTADGFNADPKIHIPLPDSLKTVQNVLRKVGMSQMADDLELRLNRAAEKAVPEAKELFWNAISDMSMDDARKIYNGPKDSATRYFQGKMSNPLAQRMRPIVDSSLSEVGAIQSYDAMMGQYKQVPFVPDVKADLTDHALGKAMDGLFYYIAQEEARIRENPAARTTELLKKVFGR